MTRSTSRPTFEHRHYVKIAAILAGMPDHAPSLRACKESAIASFADGLSGTNSNYSRERFVSAARGEPSNGRDRA